MQRNFIGGTVEGYNYENVFPVDLNNCNDLIIVDRRYFMKNLGFIQSWALEVEKEEKINKIQQIPEIIEEKITQS
jgi:hypothetical protein